jgi:hypothetical protein
MADKLETPPRDVRAATASYNAALLARIEQRERSTSVRKVKKFRGWYHDGGESLTDRIF